MGFVVPMRLMVHTCWLVDSDEREKSVASVPMPGKKSKKMADFVDRYGEFSRQPVRATYLWLQVNDWK